MTIFSCFFSRLIVYLAAAEYTHARKKSNKGCSKNYVGLIFEFM